MTTGPYECEYRAVRPDESDRLDHRARTDVRGEDGTAQRMVGVSRDISAQREAAQEREQLLLQRAAGARRSRAPEPVERRVPGHAQPRAANADERHSRLVEHAGERQAGRATPTTASPSSAATPKPRRKLIEDLLEMNKLMSGTVRLEIAPVDVSASVDGAIQALQPAADAKGVQL